MSDENKFLIPALLAGAAVYFGITKNGSAVADITKTAVGRVVDKESTHRSNNRNKSKQLNHKRRRQKPKMIEAKIIK